MEGDRLLTLFEPGPIALDDDGNEVRGAPIQHEVWARKRDRRGAETLSAETEYSESRTTFRIRWLPSIAFISSSWWAQEQIVFAEPVPVLFDGLPLVENGVPVHEGDYRRVWDIEDIEEVPAPRKRWLDLICTGRDDLAIIAHEQRDSGDFNYEFDEDFD